MLLILISITHVVSYYRMFPVPHYDKCPSGAGPQEGRVPFRRFVVFMVLPLGGFHGSAVLQLCHAPPHIILNKSRTLRVPVHVAACPEGGTPAFI